MIHKNSAYYEFFQQPQKYSFSDIDKIFGRSFTLNNIHKIPDVAASYINKLSNIDQFKQIIDKLYLSPKDHYPLEYFYNRKTANKKDKLAHLFEKFQKLKFKEDEVNSLFFSAWYTRENELFSVLLEKYYNNDLSDFYKEGNYEILAKHFLLHDVKLVEKLNHYHFKFSYNDMNFLPAKNKDIVKIIQEVGKSLPLNAKFVMDIEDGFGDDVSSPLIALKRDFDFVNNPFHLSVKRPDVLTTIAALLIKKDYDEKTVEKFIFNQDFTHSQADIFNKRQLYDIKTNKYKEINDFSKWQIFAKKYPNATIYPEVTIFASLISNLFDNQIYKRKNYEQEYDNLLRFMNEMLCLPDLNLDIYASRLYSIINNKNIGHDSEKLPVLLINMPDMLLTALNNKQFFNIEDLSAFEFKLLIKNNEIKSLAKSEEYNDTLNRESYNLATKTYFSRAKKIQYQNIFAADNEILDIIDNNNYINHKELYKIALDTYIQKIVDNPNRNNNINQLMANNFPSFMNHYLKVNTNKDILTHFDNILLSNEVSLLQDSVVFQLLLEERKRLYQENKTNMNHKNRL